MTRVGVQTLLMVRNTTIKLIISAAINVVELRLSCSVSTSQLRHEAVMGPRVVVRKILVLCARNLTQVIVHALDGRTCWWLMTLIHSLLLVVRVLCSIFIIILRLAWVLWQSRSRLFNSCMPSCSILLILFKSNTTIILLHTSFSLSSFLLLLIKSRLLLLMLLILLLLLDLDILCMQEGRPLLC